ncbi:MAG TPA: type ISP restriction/modification enzyme [Ilumatobacter sp.]|nr:type ISP restriction/modification enzyme [Ilumatobacter sp.]
MAFDAVSARPRVAAHSIHDFKTLVAFLSEELGWPIDVSNPDSAAFDYEPSELGLDKVHKVKVREIRQLRPFLQGQPWGIFYLDFEPKRLPMVVLRRILGALVPKKRQSAAPAQRAVWACGDLLFVSILGESDRRTVSFAHFQDVPDGPPQLQSFSWDDRETHLFYLETENLDRLRWPRNTNDSAAWRDSWSRAFTAKHLQTIRSSKELSLELANVAKRTRALIREIYRYESKGGPLHTIHAAFGAVLIHDLDVDRFADMVAQTISYGLFSARATGQALLGVDHLESMIPNTNPFLQALFKEFAHLGGHRASRIDFDELGVRELVDLLNAADIDVILRDFGRQTGGGVEDPVVHFYESFLRNYDPEEKVERGVFYTPKPVVDFIVRSVDALLVDELECPAGLADNATMRWRERRHPRVTILDPAVGTGTFLVSAMEVVSQRTRSASQSDKGARSFVAIDDHFLKRTYGFELMMAPYTVAHMKLGLKLKELGYDFRSNERLRVFLTNTLEEAIDIPMRLFAPFLAAESEQAGEVKTNVPVTVVLGNPPYSGISANRGEWISGLLRGRLPDGTKVPSYYEVDGQPLGEKKLWLQDDYVKFMRYGQWLVERTGSGILAFITNHSYIDNPTFRGMRQQLMRAFSDIYVLDLHGNMQTREVAPDGSADENVFEIRQGVAIGLFIKRRGAPGATTVKHADLWGTRQSKYDFLRKASVGSVSWQSITPARPYYLFRPDDSEMRSEYESSGPRLTELMPVSVSGVVTARDRLVVDLDADALLDRIDDFRSRTLSDADLREKYFGGKGARQYESGDSRGWKLAAARKRLREDKHWRDRVIACCYRPFDVRPMYFVPWMVDWPRPEVMHHMTAGPNIALVVARQQSLPGEWRLLGVCDGVMESSYISNKTSEINYLFPLFLYPKNGEPGKRANFSDAFTSRLSQATGLPLDFSQASGAAVSPLDVFAYVYAVLSSTSYRARYASLLRMDFPHVPTTVDANMFRRLSELGSKLIKLNLPALRDVVPVGIEFSGRGSAVVDRGFPTFECSQPGATGRVVVNSEGQGFDGVPEAVWTYRVGAYQVAEKWLKDRRGRRLSQADQLHYRRMITAIGSSMALVKSIEDTVGAAGGWPLSSAR